MHSIIRESRDCLKCCNLHYWMHIISLIYVRTSSPTSIYTQYREMCSFDYIGSTLPDPDDPKLCKQSQVFRIFGTVINHFLFAALQVTRRTTTVILLCNKLRKMLCLSLNRTEWTGIDNEREDFVFIFTGKLYWKVSQIWRIQTLVICSFGSVCVCVCTVTIITTVAEGNVR